MKPPTLTMTMAEFHSLRTLFYHTVPAETAHRQEALRVEYLGLGVQILRGGGTTRQKGQRLVRLRQALEQALQDLAVREGQWVIPDAVDIKGEFP